MMAKRWTDWLEVPTISGLYKAYFSGLNVREYPNQKYTYGQKYGMFT